MPKRQSTPFTKTNTIISLHSMINHMEAGFPPKVLRSHYPFGAKLMNMYWHQIHGNRICRGGIPGVKTLLSSRPKQLVASLFCIIYLQNGGAETPWQDSGCLNVILDVKTILDAYAVAIDAVGSWALAKLFVTGEVTLRLCRTCGLIYVQADEAGITECCHCHGSRSNVLRRSLIERCKEADLAYHKHRHSVLMARPFDVNTQQAVEL